MSGSSFDRLRPRAGGRATPSLAQPADPQGKRALFSDDVQAPTPGSVALTCDQCERRTVVSLVRLARLSLPGLHIIRPQERRVAWRAWAACPSCGERSWVHLSLR